MGDGTTSKKSEQIVSGRSFSASDPSSAGGLEQEPGAPLGFVHPFFLKVAVATSPCSSESVGLAQLARAVRPYAAEQRDETGLA
jgi:hypothetical protein